MARPSEYSKKKADLICEQMIAGKGLLEICREAGMPDRNTVYRWLERQPEFRDNYTRAREAMCDYYVEQILVIAFNESGDIVIDGKKTVANHAKVQRDRLKVDSLKWIVSKLFPRQYGDKLLLDGNKPGLSHEQALDQLDQGPTVGRLMKSIDGKTRGLNVLPPFERIERIIVGVKPLMDDDGNMLNTEEKLRARIQELQDRLDGKGEAKQGEAPKLLEFDPGPLPKGLDAIVLAKLLQVIKNCVPRADQRDPQEVIDEVLGVCESALRMRYREVDIPLGADMASA
ncbi:hypothetical protein [Tardiphaga sp. 709]|uniref:terminase small subunit-like protein n=1 Tax=Tardiphaga sp. 709 TaxID=3076039 RepID=UPI0028E39EC8|nr:hypothetical protein [Tardiphaga sp. 709]WNV10177.1 hypothetical protein RSO67_02990 [Tardiphaga sp. 709]